MLWAYPPSCRLPLQLRRHAPYILALVSGIAERHEASFIAAPTPPTSQIAFQLNLSGYVFASWIGRGLWGRILTCSSIRATSLLSRTATPESLTSTTPRMWGRAETQRMFRLLREWDEFYPLGEVLLYLVKGNPPLVLSVLFYRLVFGVFSHHQLWNDPSCRLAAEKFQE